MVARLAILLVIWAGSAFAQDQRLLTVYGNGTSATAPDMALVRIGVQSADRRADEALRKNSIQMTAVFEVLEKLGIATKDIQTTDVSLYPQYDNRSQGQGVGIAQYTAQNMLAIRVRDIAQVGAVLDAVNRAGVNQINGISFDVADGQSAQESARINAVLNGREKAVTYAAAAGVLLGDLITIEELGGRSQSPVPMARMESMAVDVPVAGGEVGFSANVKMVFEIE